MAVCTRMLILVYCATLCNIMIYATSSVATLSPTSSPSFAEPAHAYSSSTTSSATCGLCTASDCPIVSAASCPGQVILDGCKCCNVCLYAGAIEPRPQQQSAACDLISCARNEICVLNIQGIPMCRCPSMFWCRRSVKQDLCGPDGQTFRSRCYHKHEECTTGTKIRIAHKGPCVSEAAVSKSIARQQHKQRQAERKAQKELERLDRQERRENRDRMSSREDQRGRNNRNRGDNNRNENRNRQQRGRYNGRRIKGDVPGSEATGHATSLPRLLTRKEQRQLNMKTSSDDNANESPERHPHYNNNMKQRKRKRNKRKRAERNRQRQHNNQ